jgi:hypothetical protein
MNESVETGVGFKDVQSLFTGHLVPTVNQVHEDTGSGRGEVSSKRLCDESVQLAIRSVD